MDKQFIEQLPIAICWKDINFKYQYCNDYFWQLTKLNKNDLIGKILPKSSTITKVQTNVIQEINKLDKEIVTQKNQVTSHIKKTTFDKGIFYTIKGQPTYNEGKINGISYAIHETDVKNHIEIKQNKFLNQIGEDIFGKDFQKTMNEDEQEKWIKSFLATIIHYMPGYVYWKNKELVYLGCNKNIVDLTGIKSRKEVIGKNDYDFAKLLKWDKATSEGIRRIDSDIINGLAFSSSEETLKDHNGNPIILRTNKTPIKDKNGNIIGIMGISVDITDRKNLELDLIAAKEKAEQANASKANFIAVMSHEFRTPLNSIFGIAQDLVRQKNLTATQKKQLKAVLFSGDHLIGLINDVLDFSKLEAGKLTLEFEEFDLRQLVKDTTTSLQHMVEDKPVKLLAKYSEKAPNMIVADPRRFRQIIINFVNNAIKFTDEGQIAVKVNTCDKGNKLMLSVQDTGIGIPKDKVDNVFDRFSQVDTHKYNRNYGGTGLGLAICKQLVGNMQGSIGVETKYGKGSTFWFKIPLDLKATVVRKVKKKANIEHIIEDDVTPLDKPCSLLLIEDNPMNQMVARLIMDDLGCKYDIASSGFEGIELFENNDYDVIFTDISMPKMNGIEVMRKIREQQRGETLPIIAMTAHVMDEDRDACMEAGASDVLEKPILFPAFKALVCKWLK